MKFSVFSLISMFMVTANALATPTDPEDDAPKLIKRADRPWPPSKPWPPTFPRPSFPPQLIHPLAANTTEIIIPKPRTTTTHPLGPTHGPAHKPWPSLPPQFQHFKPSPDPTPEPELVPEPTHTPPPPPPSPPGGPGHRPGFLHRQSAAEPTPKPEPTHAAPPAAEPTHAPGGAAPDPEPSFPPGLLPPPLAAN